jgi:hypothetical protein
MRRYTKRNYVAEKRTAEFLKEAHDLAFDPRGRHRNRTRGDSWKSQLADGIRRINPRTPLCIYIPSPLDPFKAFYVCLLNFGKNRKKD